ncbi:MAG: beta-ketoacyl synthase, partial [Anaerolinea sp.]|nr:beta-ketoacyl synthase [Anaerolinea sp.]
HSLGEYAALVASGVLTFSEALEVVSARGREMSKIKVEDPGGMAAVSAPLEEVEKVLKAVEGYIVIANVNSPVQSVLGGTSEAIESAISMFKEAGFQAVRIPVSHAFHTKIVAPASEPVRQVIERMHVMAPKIPIVANVTGELYPSSAEEITDLLAKQVASPVQFVKSMQTLYNLGTRVFVEVGPKRVLNALATDNMKSKTDTIVLATNHPRKGGQASFNEALCGLYAAGVLSNNGIENQIDSKVNQFSEMKNDQKQFVNGQNQFAVLTGSVVITGAGLGLPGRDKKVFDDSNISNLLNGEMRIEALPENIRKEMLEKRVTRLIKSDAGAVMEEITDLDQVLKLAGQSGSFDLEEEYGVPAERVDSLDISTQLAFAAGVDALRDAGIPLVMHHRRTSKGTLLPDGWKLPESMQDETGVIFCSAFPGLNRMAEEAGRFYEAKSLQRQLSEVMAMEDLLLALNPTGQTHFQNEIIRRKTELELKLDEVNYHFDRRFIFRVLSMGHSQFAEYIGARGPNTSVNAACATTTQGIGVAEDWIRTGRCRRVIVIAGDDVSDSNLASWIGTSLFASGAATTEGNLRLAALPFDKRRNGMIMGMGAAALIIESQDGAEERGIRPICEIVSSQFSNSAFHGTRLDINHVASLMDTLVSTAEKRFGIDRNSIASKTVFISHETYTPARGGSASAEIYALRHTFKNNANKVIIANTKGYTGHTMGVGIEDVLAVKALETGKVPPIAHIKEGFEPDPDLGDLLLSQGGEYNPEFALRLGAGFGSQIAMVLYRKIEGAGERINHPVYDNWLKAITGYSVADLELEKRTLRVKSQGVPVNDPIKSSWQFGLLPGKWAVNTQPGSRHSLEIVPVAKTESQSISTQVAQVNQPSVNSTSSLASVDSDAIKAHVLEVVSEKTGYPVDMLDLELDLEADLGIDTVKQAELFASIRTHYGIPRREDLKLSDYNTLEKVIGFVKDNLPNSTVPLDIQRVIEVKTDESLQTEPVQAEESIISIEPADEELSHFVLSTVSEKTGYPIEMLDLDLDLEADLGIDTVKQAELFATIRTHFGIPKREDLRLSDYNTLAKVMGFVKEGSPALVSESLVLAEPENTILAVHAADEKSLTLRVPKPVLLPRIDLCEPTGVSLANGRVIILKGRDKLTGETAKQLTKLLESKKVEVLTHEAAESLEAAEVWLKAGPLSGVYCLTGLDSDPAWNESKDVTWKEAVNLRVEPLLELVKLVPSNAFLISATRMGGLHGLMNASNPLGGTISGFTKAYSRERSAALVKVVDYQASAKPAFVAETLLQETLGDSASLEIGRENELRFTLSLAEVQNPTLASNKFSNKDVFVVSGGTGGITSAVIDDLARRSKGSFILLSRTALADLSAADRSAIQSNPTAFKNNLMKEMTTSGEKVTPVQLEARFGALERAAATLALIERVEGYGAKATYIQCDVTDSASITQAIAAVEKSVDHVDYFIHAAGLEKSRKLESKTLEEFHQVVDVKVGGFLNLFTALEKSQRLPKSVVFFSSIAGRFGNAGQPDYSAGNDFLSKMAAWLPTQYADLQVISLDWGAWAEIGMASRGSIPLVMERAGIEMLKPGLAAPVVGDQILAGNSGEIVVAGSLGMFERAKIQNHGMNVQLADAALRAGNPIHKMLSHLTAYTPENGITLEVTLDPQEITYLRDHSINGVPVLPGVVGIEGFTRAAKHISSALAAAKSGFVVERLEQIEFLAPFKFYGNKSRAMAWKAGATRIKEGLRVDVTLESDTERINGKVDHVEHFKGQVYLTLKDIVSPNNAVPPKWSKNKEVSSNEIYQLYFHGPSFQVLEAAQRSGSSVLGRFNNNLININADEPGLFTTPLLIELCFQTAGLWEAGSTGNLGLPHSIGKLRVYRNVTNGDTIFAEVKPKEIDGQLYFDARVVDSKGIIYLDLMDYRTSPQVETPNDQHLLPMKTLVAKSQD